MIRNFVRSFHAIRYEVKDKVARITLNRPEKLNAINELMPGEIKAAVEKANFDDNVKVIVLQGEGRGFCAGYDLKELAEQPRGHDCSQEMPWDPYKDYKFMGYYSTESMMSLWRSLKPTIAKLHGVCIGGGTDMALVCDITFAAESTRIGYPPVRVWGCPTTAMWTFRLGIEKAKRIMFTGDLLSGKQAAELGLIGEAVPDDQLDKRVNDFIARIITVPTNQLFFQKQVINHIYEQMGLFGAQRLATLLDGMTRHTPEGISFQQRCQEVGFKQAVKERDTGKTSYSD